VLPAGLFFPFVTHLAIIGPGLLGGSIALAARARGLHRVALWARRPEAVEEIERRGIADLASTDLKSVVAGADLVVLCVPVGAMPELAQQIVEFLPRAAVVTDVGSVKAKVCASLGGIFRSRARFVGSHPMAGSEQTGLAAARAELFEGSVSIITPGPEADLEAVALLEQFWSSLGCRVAHLAPEEHDEMVALVSHLPHLLAATLVNLISSENARAFDFCGPGFRDTTRVASGPPAMWAEILATNHEPVRRAAEAMIEKLREIVTLLDRDPPMTDFLTQAKTQRDRLRLPKTPHV
jgi:prephenate dehydrogenase